MILFTGSGALSEAFAKQFKCQIISARTLDDAQLTEWLKKATVVIHNAAAIQADSLGAFVEANFGLTKWILDLIFLLNPNIRFFNISSMSLLHDADTYLSPDKMTDYAFSKFLSELYCQKHPLSINHQNVVNIRFSTLFYADAARDGLSKLGFDAVKNKKITLINQGIALRDFIPIHVAAAYLKKLTERSFLPSILNIASGQPLNFKHFADLILKHDPSVKMDNIAMPTQNVLCDFSTTALEHLGKITFDMDAVFETYLKEITT